MPHARAMRSMSMSPRELSVGAPISARASRTSTRRRVPSGIADKRIADKRIADKRIGGARFDVDRASGKIGGVSMPYAPMLASSTGPRRLTGRWVLEPKFDGWRVIVEIDAPVRAWTRRGLGLTERLSELAALADVVDAS